MTAITVVVKKNAEECTPAELALGAALEQHRIHGAMRKAHSDGNPAAMDLAERALGAALALEAFAEKLEEFDAARSGSK